MLPQIRILAAADAGELFRLRRAALLDLPFAFLASPEDDLASSQDAAAQLLKQAPGSVVFGAFTERLVGMLGLYRAGPAKAAHKGNIWGMFVLPQWRRQGLAKRLLEAVITHARTIEGIVSVRLSVSESAFAARRLYEGAGFKCWGVEPDAIRLQGRSECDYHLALSIDPRPPLSGRG